MAYTQTDLTNIQSAIASGALTVRVNGKLVTYRDMSDLIMAEQRIQQSLNASAGRSSSMRHQLADFSG